MQINLKIANDSNIPVVLEMMAAFNAIDHYPFGEELTKQNLETFLSDESLGRLWLVRCDDEIVGYVVLTFGFSFEYRGRDAIIDELYLKESYRGKGIGGQVMDFVAGQSQMLGLNAIHLEVERHNEKAQKLYLGKGYVGSDRELLTKKLF